MAMADYQIPILAKDEDVSSIPTPLIFKLKRCQWWLLVSINIFFLIGGQIAGILLGRFYYNEGGSSKWMATLVQTAGFPILYIPLLLLKQYSSDSSSCSLKTIVLIYVVLGSVIAGDNMLYSVGLLCLSASTHSLICASQLAFNAVFSYFINSQKFTALILNSVVVLSFSAALIAMNNDDSESPSGVAGSNSKYVIGFVCTLAASCLYSLLLSLMQLSFEKILKKETFSVVLEMQIYTSLVASCASVIGLFASGEWRTLRGEMGAFRSGEASYVMTLVGASVAWQVISVAVLGLIFLVSSLFSNVISTLSLAITPTAAWVAFHDRMSGVKIVAILMAVWGSASYVYQNYKDDLKVRRRRSAEADDHGRGLPC